MKTANLEGRALVNITGDDAEKFLENLITCRVEGMAESTLKFGALLTPQGKILFDFFVFRSGASFVFDLHESLADEFIKRMTFYKLRAKVEIAPAEDLEVFAVWEEKNTDGMTDPRMTDLGCRVYDKVRPNGAEGDYIAHRVACGVPEGGMDFDYGDAYPHEVLMDQYSGVDFKKGCFVGQEVVSRMQHRGTTKKRVVPVSAENSLPATGTEIRADGKPAGTLGTVSKKNGLALLRLDRVAKAQTIMADETPLKVGLQNWVNFTMPDEAGKNADGEG